MSISKRTSIFSEPKCLVTGVEGAGKTLFAVQQADLLTRAEGGELYQLNIRGADPAHLPKLPFAMTDMAYNSDGTPRLDPETGDHLPMWATLPEGSVIIVDEAHKVFPQRGPGRPPKAIEMLAEGRQHGIRFILLTQAPASMDAFLRDRTSRHFHLERKGNMQRATVFEFDHCVLYPQTAWMERKQAQHHFWAYPKEYFGWYTSAKSHHFKLRIPLKVWAALALIPVAGFMVWKVTHSVGAMMSGAEASDDVPAETRNVSTVPGVSAPKASKASGEKEVLLDPDAYKAQFNPVVKELPWSAPAFQSREVVAEPDLYCVEAGEGEDGNGRWREASCRCFTEQGTPYAYDKERCAHVASHGLYNPFRRPLSVPASGSELQGRKPEEPRVGAAGVGPAAVLIGSGPAAGPAGDLVPVVPVPGV